MKLNSSKFVGTKATFFSNCIYSESNILFAVYFCLFLNNIAYGNYYLISETSGRAGCIEAIAKIIHITYSEFYNNSKNEGGAINLNYPFPSTVEANILISNCWFLNNSAVIGGGINIAENYQTNICLKQNYFGFNLAIQSKSLVFIYLFIYFKRWRSWKF